MFSGYLRFIVFGLGLILSRPLFAAWDPNAGLVTPLTTGATLSATSSGSNLSYVLDGNTDSAWQSDACLPTGYIARTELNKVLGVCATGKCTSSGSTNLKDATDNDPYTGAYLPLKPGNAWAVIPLSQSQPLYQIGVRGFGNQPILVEAVTASGNQTVATLTTADNYQYRRFAAPANQLITATSATPICPANRCT